MTCNDNLHVAQQGGRHWPSLVHSDSIHGAGASARDAASFATKTTTGRAANVRRAARGAIIFGGAANAPIAVRHAILGIAGACLLAFFVAMSGPP
jgi:hypothetical protein